MPGQGMVKLNRKNRRRRNPWKAAKWLFAFMIASDAVTVAIAVLAAVIWYLSRLLSGR